MSLLALITALLLEQLRPLSSRKYLYGWLSEYADFFQRQFNAGAHSHGRIAWLLAVVPLLTGIATLFWLVYEIHPIFAWAFNVLVLYLTMGFRQFSHYFTGIHKALLEDRLDEARSMLTRWRGMSSNELNNEEVARLTIEEALLASHQHVFGVIVWFVITMLIGLGPVGAVLYRIVLFLNARWGEKGDGEFGRFGEFAHQVFHIMEWLPLRMTAMTFAIVGNFEDTVYCWRTQVASWPDREEGLLLASGAGALGVRLGMPIPEGGLPFDRPELGVGDDADADFMQSAVGLVWRSVVFWLILMLLLTLANLLG
ncbi:MAG: CobD/CbiB family protein [Gallionella sp.]|nr:CobD/CbiB family protein [Gallionella sp.]